MQLHTKFLVGLFLLFSVALPSAQSSDLPDGWFRAGSRPSDYEMSTDPAGGRSGGAAFIKARVPVSGPSDFGTIMQEISADAYQGKRLQLSAYVRSADVSNWAGLWMRVDGAAGKPLAFDNMQGRPIKGTRSWQSYQIVLDVPTEAQGIAFGILLAGPGQVWLDDVQFDIVGSTVATTDLMTTSASVPRVPKNLSFNK